MSGQLVVNRVTSQSIGIRGRSLNSARTNHFIVDYAGSAAEAITPVEAFLAGISSCGVLIVEDAAHQSGVPLQQVTVSIESVRTPDRVSIQSVAMRFQFTGPSAQQAEELVETYKSR